MKTLRISGLALLGALWLIMSSLAGQVKASTMQPEAALVPPVSLAPQPMEFTSQNHILGFMPQRVYFAGLDHMLRIEFVDTAGVDPQVSPEEGNFSPYVVPAFSTVTYSQLWRGIDVSYESQNGALAKSMYTVAPGASVSQIKLHYSAPVNLQPDGSLHMSLPNERGYVTESAPVAWQEIAGKRLDVAVSFDAKNDTVGFKVEPYSQRYPLIIDPIYVWHTFYSANTVAHAIALNANGDIYVAGEGSSTWNGDHGANPRHAYKGGTDIFILKLDKQGAYQWHTFYGSNQSDAAWGIATDTSNNLYVTGYSETSWKGDGGANPLHPHSATNGQLGLNLFCLKLNSTGAYQWHTFYGSTDPWGGSGIAVDSNGAVNIDGYSYGSWLGDKSAKPLHAHSGGFSDSGLPATDLFVLQLNTNGAYRWHTFYGEKNTYEAATAIAFDRVGNIYVTGSNGGEDWQVDNNAKPLHTGGGYNGIVVLKLDHNGAYRWHTFYPSGEGGSGITLDSSENVYVAGDSFGAWLGDGNASPLHAFTGASDMTVVKLNSDGGYQWHTFYGGAPLDEAFGIASTTNGVAIVGYSDGSWQGDSRPPLHPYDGSHNSHNIAVLKLDSQGGYQWNTFYGFDSISWGIAADPQGNLFVVSTGGGWKGDNGQEPLHSDGHVGILKLGHPVQPTLLSPENKSTVVKIDNKSVPSDKRVLLNWANTQGALTYHIVLRQDNSKGNVIASADNSVSQFRTPKLTPSKMYFWRVQACNELGCGPWSPWWQFEIKSN